MDQNLNVYNHDIYEKVCKCYAKYEQYSLYKLQRKIKNFDIIPEYQKLYFKESFNNRISSIKEAIHCNQIFINEAIKASSEIFGSNSNIENNEELYLPNHMDTVLRQVFREWSSDGNYERNLSFKKIIDLFCILYPDNQRSNIKVLVPGSGLGRLVCDLASTGCECIHNDDDMFMISISYAFLNNIFDKDSFTIYPWVNDLANNFGGDRLLYSVKVPDIILDPNIKISACVGSFLNSFNDCDENFDCIVTCFFIDSTDNVITTLEKIYKLLKTDGIWINLGPLSFQFENDSRSTCIEPTLEELKNIIYKCLNFKEVKGIEFIECPYFYNKHSMSQHSFISAFFAVKK